MIKRKTHLACVCKRGAFLLELSFAIAAADASLRRDRDQRIAKLRQRYPQQGQLILAEPTGEGVGDGCDRSCQFAGIHKRFTSAAII